MKKLGLFGILIAFILNCGGVVFGFEFPTPDWGGLLRERTKIVEETEFELYAEAPVDTAPYYGQKFEPRGGTYIGSVAENSKSIQPLGSYFTSIYDMYQDDLYYPANEMIKTDNVITMVGWTISNLNTISDSQIRKVLNNLSCYNKPMLIRFANEMNCSSLGDDPTLYVNTFRRVANIIHEYPNFGVVWSPIDIGALDRPFEYFYPGDEYVDWVGVSCYSIKYFQGNINTEYKNSVYFMTGDYAWATKRIKPFMDYLDKNNIKKPVMISEGGVATNNIYGEELEVWAKPRLRNMLWYLNMKYPKIKMINYFDTFRPDENERFNIFDYTYARNIFNEAKNNGSYILEFGGNADFVYQPVNSAGTLIANEGMVKLYTLAYIPNQPLLSVNYYVDGQWYHSSSEIPYQCYLNVSNLSDGAHTLEISTLNNKKEYIFYKKGNSICFGKEPEGQGIIVTVNGQRVNFDQQPIIKDGRTFVPVRAIFEALGASVDWYDETQTVVARKGDITVTLKIGDIKMNVCNEVKILDVPAMLQNGRTLVPARAVSEAFGCTVDWDEAAQTVIIKEASL